MKYELYCGQANRGVLGVWLKVSDSFYYPIWYEDDGFILDFKYFNYLKGETRKNYRDSFKEFKKNKEEYIQEAKKILVKTML